MSPEHHINLSEHDYQFNPIKLNYLCFLFVELIFWDVTNGVLFLSGTNLKRFDTSVNTAILSTNRTPVSSPAQ